MAIDPGPTAVVNTDVTTTANGGLALDIPAGIRAQAWPANTNAMVLLTIPRDQITEGRVTVSINRSQQASEIPANDNWLNAALAELRDLARDASTAGWKGGNEPALAVGTQEDAELMLRLLAPNAPRAELGVGRKGQVSLDWWGPADKSLTIEVHPGRRVIFAVDAPKAPFRGVIEVDSETKTLPPALRFAIEETFREPDTSRD